MARWPCSCPDHLALVVTSRPPWLRLLTAVSLLVVYSLLITSPRLTAAQDDGQPCCQRLVVIAESHLRQQPAASSTSLIQLPAGTLVWRFGPPTAGDWQQVRWLDGPEAVTGWLPETNLREVALYVAVSGVALRATPALNASFLHMLPPDSEVWAFESVLREDHRWQHLWLAAESTGWAAADLLEPYNVTTSPPILLMAWPGTRPAEDAPTLLPGWTATILEVAPGGRWLRLLTADDRTGWAAADAVLNLPVAVPGRVNLPSSIRDQGVNLRALPEQDATVIGSLPHEAPVRVVGRDAASAWLLAITPRGRLAWIRTDLVHLSRGFPHQLAVVETP